MEVCFLFVGEKLFQDAVNFLFNFHFFTHLFLFSAFSTILAVKKQSMLAMGTLYVVQHAIVIPYDVFSICRYIAS